MPRVLATRACRPCATSKRKCGKQTPSCVTCSRRGATCVYELPRPNRFSLQKGEQTVLLGEDTKAFEIQGSAQAQSAGIFDPEFEKLLLSLVLHKTGESAPLTFSWFTGPDTWKVVQPPRRLQSACFIPIMKRLTEIMRQWLTDLANSGSNAFIHHKLYQSRIPKCLQDAFLCVTAYLNKTVANEDVVFQIIEHRVKNFVEDNGSFVIDASLGLGNNNAHTPDLIEHLARVQALLMYQIICLFDGNIRLRFLAEGYITVLTAWLQTTLERFKDTACIGHHLLADASTTSDIQGQDDLHYLHQPGLLWLSWAGAESIRRTWIASAAVQGSFMAIQKGEMTPCLGGMVFTARKGVWEAPSAVAWESICLQASIGLMQVGDSARIFKEFTPDEVGDWAKVVLEIVFGTECVEQWAA